MTVRKKAAAPPTGTPELAEILERERRARADLAAEVVRDNAEALQGVNAKKALDHIVGEGTHGVVLDFFNHRLLADTDEFTRLVFEETLAWLAYRGSTAAADSEYPMSMGAGVQASRVIVRDAFRRLLAGEPKESVYEQMKKGYRAARESLGQFRLGDSRGSNSTEYGLVDYFIGKSERFTLCYDLNGREWVEWNPRGRTASGTGATKLWMDLLDAERCVVQVLRVAKSQSRRLSQPQIGDAIRAQFKIECSASELKKALARMGRGGSGTRKAFGLVDYLRTQGYALLHVPLGAPARTDTIE